MKPCAVIAGAWRSIREYYTTFIPRGESQLENHVSNVILMLSNIRFVYVEREKKLQKIPFEVQWFLYEEKKFVHFLSFHKPIFRLKGTIKNIGNQVEGKIEKS